MRQKKWQIKTGPPDVVLVVARHWLGEKEKMGSSWPARIIQIASTRHIADTWCSRLFLGQCGLFWAGKADGPFQVARRMRSRTGDNPTLAEGGTTYSLPSALQMHQRLIREEGR